MLMLSEFEEFQVRSSLWHKQLDAAASTGDVVEILQDFAVSLTPAQLGSLPEKCRPGRLKDEEDVAYWTFVLAQHHCRPPDFDLGLFQDVLNHFLHASLRISEIRKSRG